MKRNNNHNRSSLCVIAAAVLLLFHGTVAQSGSTSNTETVCYPIQIEIYDSQSDCDSGGDPSAVGQLYADDTCRATQVISSDSTNITYKFPGRYVAKCNGSQLEIAESGCLNSDCSNSNNDDSQVCDRAFTPASFYSRLPSPLFPLQESDSFSQRFCMVLSDPDGNNIIFTLIGDCTQACGNRTAVPSSPTTFTDAPSDSPTEASIPTTSPTIDAPSSTPSLRPSISKAPTPPPSRKPSSDTTGGSGGNGDNPVRSQPTLAPTPKPATNPAGASSNISASQNSKVAIGIIVGSIVAGVCAVLIVLLIGFFLGVFRQRKIDAQSRDSTPSEEEELYYNNTGGYRVAGMGHAGGSMPIIAAAVASTTATARTPPMFESTQIIIPDHEDDISTLGTPLGVNFLEDNNSALGGESNYYYNDYNNGGGLLVKHQMHPMMQPQQTGEEKNNGTTIDHDSEFLLSAESKVFQNEEKSFEMNLDDTNAFGGIQPRTETGAANVFDGAIHFIVTVPPGKLGMVIDDYCNVAGGANNNGVSCCSSNSGYNIINSNKSSQASPNTNMATTSVSTGGTPTVHALKDDSILMQRGVRVGDMLETVDGVDVTQLNCLDVSRMITSKSSSTRVLGFARKKAIQQP